jgi:hypothetical protein
LALQLISCNKRGTVNGVPCAWPKCHQLCINNIKALQCGTEVHTCMCKIMLQPYAFALKKVFYGPENSMHVHSMYSDIKKKNI